MRQPAFVFLATCLAALTLVAQQTPDSSALRIGALSASMDSLHELSDSIEALSRTVSPAVVQVFSTGYGFGEEEGEAGAATSTGLVTRQRSSGSGVVLSADGYIITN